MTEDTKRLVQGSDTGFVGRQEMNLKGKRAPVAVYAPERRRRDGTDPPTALYSHFVTTKKQGPSLSRPRPARKRSGVWLAAGLGVAALATGCGSSTSSSAAPTSLGPASAPTSVTPATGAPRGSGPVKVLYAGSLVNLMEKQIGPGFHSATGYTLEGFPGGSTALGTEIKGKVRQGDVFVSASPTVDANLEGPANGNWVSWYATFASSPLVLGYNPSSRFANDISSKPWYQAVTEPGILVGRTDPATDPKGKLTVKALDAAARQYGAPALTSLAQSTAGVYPEETLVGRLQAGQLDAGFLYSSEAASASIPTVAVDVPGQELQATYTVTVLGGAPDEAAAEAFVAYLLGPQGQAALRKDGFDVAQPPKVSGQGVPAGLRQVLSGS